MYSKIALALLLLLCQPAWGQTLRRGIGPEPDSLDIHQAQGLSAIQVLREIREGLVTFNAAGETVPGVAESWQVSEGGRLYRFRLREDARWSNGDRLVAADFVRAWRRALTPSTAARNAGLLTVVENGTEVLTGLAEPDALGAAAIGELELQVRLTRAQAWFPEILTHPVSYPLHAEGEERPGEKAVNGPFMIERMVPHALIRLVPNPHFHAAGSIGVDVLELLPIEDPPAELSRYRAGELHITESIPPGRFDWLRENYGSELRVAPYLGSFWLGYNLSKTPLRDNPALRKALSLAIDRETLVRVVLGAGEQPAWSIVPPGMGWQEAAAPEIGDQKMREQEARRLFAMSGHDRRKTLRLELRFNTSTQHRRMAVAIAAMWKQVLGISAELINEEWKVFVNNRRQRVLTQVFRGGWIADYADPTSFLDLFRSGSAMNWSAWSNPGYDRMLDEASLLQGQERLALLRRAETKLIGDMPVIPLYYYVSRHLVKSGVKGFVDNVRDIHLSRYLAIGAESE